MERDFVVRSGVQIPEKFVRTAKHGSLYPFRAMGVGDSFAVSIPTGKKADLVQASVSSAARHFRVKYATTATRFVTRTVIEDGVHRIRCWRVS